MKRHVDLYEVRFRKQKPPLRSARLLQVCGAALGIALLLYGHGLWRNARAGDRLDAIRSDRTAASSRFVALAERYPPKQVDAQLEAALQRLTAEREAKTRLLALLSNQSLGNTSGFSEHVAGLARQRVEGLWLRGVRIGRGGREMALEGSALHPELVPRFLDDLGEEDAFAGRDFRSLRIERPENDPDHVDFALSTESELAP